MRQFSPNTPTSHATFPDFAFVSLDSQCQCDVPDRARQTWTLNGKLILKIPWRNNLH